MTGLRTNSQDHTVNTFHRDRLQDPMALQLDGILAEMREIVGHLFSLGFIDTTGGSISVRLNTGSNIFALTPTHSGFRRWKLDEGLVVLDENCERVEGSGSQRPAHPSAFVHAFAYKAVPLANAVLHAHAPYSLVFASKGKTIHPYTLQSQVLGDVPCFFNDVDEVKVRNQWILDKSEQQFTSAVAGWDFGPAHFEYLYEPILKVLGPRADELQKHGLAFTFYKHGVFVVARTLSEAFDDLIRVERNCQVQLLTESSGL